MPQCTAKSKRTGERCRRMAIRGRQTCYNHGGRTPRGVASPHFQHGRYSRSVPDRLAARHQEALEDPELVELRQEIALTDTRLAEVLGQLDRGESGALWHALQEARGKLRNARARHDVPATNALEAEIDRLVDIGVADTEAWAEVSRLIEQRRKLVEAEMRRLARLQQFLTVEQAHALLATILAAVKQSVAENCPDRALGNGILAGVSTHLGALVARGE